MKNLLKVDEKKPVMWEFDVRNVIKKKRKENEKKTFVDEKMW